MLKAQVQLILTDIALGQIGIRISLSAWPDFTSQN